MVVNSWIKIYEDNEIKIFHSTFYKMEIIKLYIFNNSKWTFWGCYILNLKYNNLKEIANYHFYTTNYFLSDSFKRMCIQPLSTLSNEHIFDSDSDIDERLISWYKNCKQKYEFGLDILGQDHGNDIDEIYDGIKNGKTWNEANIIQKNNKEYKIKQILKNYENAYYAFLIAEKLKKMTIIDIIINSKQYSVDDIFS